ncbi:MATE family efflux transporter [Bacillus canaveralius]|uniref:MATE family efflux transporter n=1 Tax=Bacillus canaveralius TaxID=1403243 RepID=UPI000F770C25|nr:MATE family efflux transporter [Bacillus canaveralius]RSK52823.1 MATE family efflux transporter [Bacillus canaveralius]
MAQHDFTTGSIYKQLIVFSTPIMLTNILQVSYQFIDSLWVGNLLGANALGAISVSATVIFTVLSFIIGINNASLTILSQQKGKDSEEGLKNYLNAFVVLQTILSLMLGAIGFVFSKEILLLLDTPEPMVAEATSYLQINFLGILFLFGYNFIGTVLRSLGDSKTPLYFVVVAVVLNAVLDPVFIKVFGLGIDGAAYATILSQGIAFLYGLAYILRLCLAPFTLPKIPRREEVGIILKLGIPAGLQMVVISAGVMAIMSVVNSLGADVVAGFGAAQRLDSIIMIPAMALGTAVNSMAGQNIGANRWDRLHKIALYGTLYNLAVMFLISAVTFLLARVSIRLFIQETAALEFGTTYLKLVAFFYPFLGINFILNGVVRGAGAMFQVLILNVISFWVLRYPLTYWFAGMFGDKGIALGMGISFVISSIIAYLYYRFGRWRRQVIFKKSE